ARLRFLVSDAMCKPVLRRDRLDFGYDNRFQNPTICSRRLPSSPHAEFAEQKSSAKRFSAPDFC
ncbi:hypothetical protein NLO85_24880, partial [Pseudomonas savastanoi]